MLIQVMRQIDLDRYFQHGSGAYQVAERLLTGQVVESHEVAAEVGVARTTVNRVVDVLREAGATIIRDRQGKRATFQLVGTTEPRSRRRLPELDAEGMLVADELVGPAHVVTVQFGRERYRGVSAGAVAVGTEVKVSGLMRDGSETSLYLTLPGGKRLRLDAAMSLGGDEG